MPLTKIRSKWEQALNKEFTDQDWGKVLAWPKSVQQLKYTQLNFVNMTYMTLHRLQTIHGAEMRNCPRCTFRDADCIHMVWDCEFLRLFWGVVTTQIGTTLERVVDNSIEVCLLGLFPYLPR